MTATYEPYDKIKDIPPLEPVFSKTKMTPRAKIFKYLNQQNIRLAYEIEPKSARYQ